MIAEAFDLFEPGADVEPLPADLRTWIGESRLACLTLDVVREVRAGLSGAAGATRVQVSGDRLLALLTGCYAAGRFSSEEIEWSTEDHPLARSLCAGLQPSGVELARYRRVNRQLIVECLAQLFVTAWRWRLGNAEVDIRSIAMAEAQRRVQLAVVYDLGLSRE